MRWDRGMCCRVGSLFTIVLLLALPLQAALTGLWDHELANEEADTSGNGNDLVNVGSVTYGMPISHVMPHSGWTSLQPHSPAVQTVSRTAHSCVRTAMSPAGIRRF